MRTFLINFLKANPSILHFFWIFGRILLNVAGRFIPRNKKTILFASFGGRKFDDSPKAIYEEICSRKEFEKYRLVWAFVNTREFILPRGEIVKVDSPKFFFTLLRASIWISNSEIDRGFHLNRKGHLSVETWHGSPLKKIAGEENMNALGGKHKKKTSRSDSSNTIRCAQSEYDLEIFKRVFNASREEFLLCDLPRNDALLKYSNRECSEIKAKLGIQKDKKIILYTPTYREYLTDETGGNYIAPPITIEKWKKEIGNEYIVLFRAHYAVTSAMNLNTTNFFLNMSDYPILNDLYAIADIMISDYSSTFVDFSILDKPMLCFAYDLHEYEEKRGLYIDLEKELPCRIILNEDDLLHEIKELDLKDSFEKTKLFHKRFAPHAGNASKAVVDEMERYIGFAFYNHT